MRKMLPKSILFLLTVFSFSVFNSSMAQDSTPIGVPVGQTLSDQSEEKENPDPKVLKPGLLASQGKTKFSSVAETSGNVSLDDDGYGDAPISASLIKKNHGRCELVLKNLSAESKYSVRVKVETFRGEGKRADSKTVSATLGPQKSVKKQVPCKGDAGYHVALKSGNRLN